MLISLRIFATNIATTLTGFADNAASGAYDIIGASAFHSTTNPTTEFQADSASIRTAGGTANTMAMNSKTWRVLVQNTFLRVGGSLISAIPPFQNTNSRVQTHPMFPGFTMYIDELIANGMIFRIR